MRLLASLVPGDASSLSLVTAPVPDPEAGQVRVTVAACGINYPDVLMIEDRYQFTIERPFAPGIEIAGTIDAVGDGVVGWSLGMRVVLQVDHGGLADFVVADASALIELPANVAFETAAASLLTYGTSYHALRDRAALRAGETLFVLGAGGGVGLAAVELGKMLGARVVAGVSSSAKAGIARKAGADVVFEYPTNVEDQAVLARLFATQCPDGVDVAYDPVGGMYAEPLIRRMRQGGRYLVVGFAGGIPRVPLNLVLLKQCALVGVFWGAAMKADPDGSKAMLRELLQLLGDGQIAPPAPTIFPLERGGLAIAALKNRTAVGKLVVRP
ncbi:zinc-binding dehydrogenase [Altererythrobacter salegens]|uniref:Zinc-binding dehydrogenase n=2 Tax=Croceibacterium salegens TaxID=1737568 RepID=A0A6I4SXQ9_9SPHN|nr:zinc-binding dehydrogenase [Croceibacterium salegens]